LSDAVKGKSGKEERFCVSLIKGVPVVEGVWGREEGMLRIQTQCVNPPKMESPNGTANLSRGKQSLCKANRQILRYTHAHIVCVTQYVQKTLCK